jgi:hypothetical protein
MNNSKTGGFGGADFHSNLVFLKKKELNSKKIVN